jgi:hypothetical protein
MTLKSIANHLNMGAWTSASNLLLQECHNRND